ncbi:molecular chaperone HscC [Luteibacter sp. Sphag1AF]|uniref:Hsp70 family protein n=1 Tax=Luteibacter sp. Sphag1AF TaxID=2587031 RepID=UPI001608E3FF|nr:Hsp70 family protein [Luteibacter sp. Sphag1AF]MBB3226136.1 molecular chaperone HscC [Luteibacter sp. Sphag1AF]
MIVGIDLGTATCLAAAWKDGRPRLIPNALGDVLTPSYVGIEDDGSVAIGRPAFERWATHPHLTSRPLQGRFDEVPPLRDGDRELGRDELIALILRSLCADAHAFLGAPVTAVVIAVPCALTDPERRAVLHAGKLAGVRVLRLLNASTAVALHYAQPRADTNSRFLVMDFGSGGVNVAAVDTFDGIVEVKACAGDRSASGDAVTRLLAGHLLDEAHASAELRADDAFMRRLMLRAEVVKRELSAGRDVTLPVIPRSSDTVHVGVKTFEALLTPWLALLWRPAERVMRDARLRAADLNAVIISGGTSQLPQVRAFAEQLFGRPPVEGVPAMEAVAAGAAMLAGMIAGDVGLSRFALTDVCAYTLGSIEDTSGGTYSPAIERNTVIPASHTRRMLPSPPDRQTLTLDLYQGESRRREDNVPVTSVRLPFADGEGTDIRFSYDANGLVSMERAEGRQWIPLAGEGLSDLHSAERRVALDAWTVPARHAVPHRMLLTEAGRALAELPQPTRARLARAMLLLGDALAARDRAASAQHAATLREMLAANPRRDAPATT